MALQIVHEYEPILVEQIILAIYGGPGLGKSSLAFTAEDPICLDFDGGAYRAKNRKKTSRINNWTQAHNMEASDFVGHKTAIVDTAGRALDKLAVKVIADDPKNSRGSGALSLQGFGEMRAAFLTWLNRLKSYGLDIVLVSHSSEERKGEDIIERLDIQGGSRAEVHKSADAMGRLYIENGARWLNFSPTEAAFGKNPGGFGPLEFKDPAQDPDFLARVIRDTKAVLNAESEAIRAMREKIEAARPVYEALDTPEKFTEQATNLANINAERAIKALLIQVAGAKGFTFDREKGLFVATPAAPATSAPASSAPANTGTGPAKRQQGASRGNRRQA